MVYNGPSKGCKGCLMRRVKCDEAKPSCRRCQKAGRDCAYRDPTTIKIRDMTASTVYRFQDQVPVKTLVVTDGSHDQRYPRPTTIVVSGGGAFMSAPSDMLSDERDEWELQEMQRSATRLRYDVRWGWYYEEDPRKMRKVWNQKLYTPPPISTEQHARAFFVNGFLDTPYTITDPGYLHILKMITTRRNAGRCLETCLSTLALASFSRRANSRVVTLEAHRSYCQSLKMVNKAFAAPGSAFDEELLASVVIMAMVELLISNSFSGYRKHLMGAVSVLRSRGGRKFRDLLGAELVMLIRTEMNRIMTIRDFEQSDEDCETWIMARLELANDPSLPAAHEVIAKNRQVSKHRLMAYNVLDKYVVSEAYAKIEDLGVLSRQHPPVEMSEKVASLLSWFRDYMRDICNSFTLPSDAGEEWYPTPHQWTSPYPWARETGNAQTISGYTWETIEYAAVGLVLLAARIHNCGTAARVAHRLRPLGDFVNTKEYRQLEVNAQEALDKVVGSVPYLLGSDMESPNNSNNHFLHTFALSPLTTALGCPFTTKQQREILKSMLQYIANDKGIKSAEAILLHLQEKELA